MYQGIGFFELAPEAQAAWAQAVLSVVAIIFAALIPHFHNLALERRNIRLKMRSIVEIAIYAEGQSYALKCLLNNPKELRNLGHWGAEHEWRQVVAAIEAIPVHELPDRRLVQLVLRLNDVCQRVADNYAQLLRCDLDDGHVPDWFAEEITDYFEVIETLAKQFRFVLLVRGALWKRIWHRMRFGKITEPDAPQA